MCYVIVVLHIHCFLAHSVCGTVSGSRYSCPKQCICPVFTAIEATFGSAGNPAAGTTGVLHEYECATYIVCYVCCSLSHTVCGQSPVIDEHRGRSDDESAALESQTSTSAKSFGHQQPPSQQQLIPPVCYVNMCYVIVVLHIHCFLAHSVCGTVSGSRYSCPKQCICPVFTAIEATFGSAGNPAAGTTGVLHEYECATYIVCYVCCSLSHTVCGQSPVIDEHRGRSDDESAALESQTST